MDHERSGASSIFNTKYLPFKLLNHFLTQKYASFQQGISTYKLLYQSWSAYCKNHFLQLIYLQLLTKEIYLFLVFNTTIISIKSVLIKNLQVKMYCWQDVYFCVRKWFKSLLEERKLQKTARQERASILQPMNYFRANLEFRFTLPFFYNKPSLGLLFFRGFT